MGIRSENMHYNASGWEGTHTNALLVPPGKQENAREVSIRLVLWDVEKKQDKHLFIDLKASISSHNRHYMQCISSLQSNMNTCCMPHIYTHYKAHNTKALSDAIWIKSLPQFMLYLQQTGSSANCINLFPNLLSDRVEQCLFGKEPCISLKIYWCISRGKKWWPCLFQTLYLSYMASHGMVGSLHDNGVV